MGSDHRVQTFEQRFKRGALLLLRNLLEFCGEKVNTARTNYELRFTFSFVGESFPSDDAFLLVLNKLQPLLV